MNPGESFPELIRLFLEDRRTAGRLRKAEGAENTVQFYKYALERLVEWTTAEGLTPATFERQDLQRYMTFLVKTGRKPGYNHPAAKKDLAPSTMAGYRAMVKSLLLFAYDSGFINAPPRFPKQRVARSSPQFLNDQQVDTVLTACERVRDRAMLSLLIDSGLRRAELVGLNWSDLEWRDGLGHVYVRRGKGAKARTSYFLADTWDLLAKYRKSRPHEPGDPVFLGLSDEHRLDVDGLASMLHRIGKRAGLRLTPHMCRHTAARRMLARHMPAPSVQRALGHSNVSLTLQLYGAFSDQMTEDAFRTAFQ